MIELQCLEISQRLVPVNNTPVVALAGHMHTASSWPRDSLLVSLDYCQIWEHNVTTFKIAKFGTYSCQNWQKLGLLKATINGF